MSRVKISVCICTYCRHVWSVYWASWNQWKRSRSCLVFNPQRRDNSTVKGIQIFHIIDGLAQDSYPQCAGKWRYSMCWTMVWTAWLMMIHQMKRSVVINPLRAEFFRRNMNIYLHFMSFLHTNKTQVVEIPPQIRQGPDNQYHGCWCPGDDRSQGISNHDIDLVKLS